MVNKFKSIGVSYKELNLELRSMVSMNEEQCQSLLLHLKEEYAINELLVVSTCNRTEIFYCSEKDLSKEIFQSILTSKGLISKQDLFPLFVFLEAKKSIERLFSIAIGLESQVLGDLQIINQVKKAYQLSADNDLAGPFLHRLMHSIFFTNKRVVQETSFRDGAASVPYATYELIQDLSNTFINAKILIIGLGEMGRDIALHLKDHEVERVTLMNRTFSKAESLANELSYTSMPFEDLYQAVSEHDIIVSSVTSDSPIITKEVIERSTTFAFKYLIDISVPASIDAKVEEVSGVLLHTIDDIQNKTSEALLNRKKSIPVVQSHIEDSIEEFLNWSQELNVSPTINKLKEALEQIRKEEVGRYLKQMDASQAEMVDVVTKSMIQKIIKLPVIELKAACKRGEAETLIDALSEVFNLEAEKQN